MKNRMVVAVLLVGCTGWIHADDWPQWRGPHGNGLSTEKGLPSRWSKESLAWKAPLGGLGVSSPVVWGERIFVTSQGGRGIRRPGVHPTLARGEEASAEKPLGGARAAGEEGAPRGVEFLVEAFHRKDGRRLWQYRFPSEGDLPAIHDKHNLASPSPVTDGRHVYAWFATGQLVALDMDGRLAWQRNIAKEHSPFEVDWGHGSSPALHGELLYLLCDHKPAAYLLALDKRTGKEKWKADRAKDRKSHSTPTIVGGPRGDELIVNSSERIDAYDPRTGELLWHTGEPNRFPIPVPAHEGGILYASRGYRSGPYMAIRTGGRGDVTRSHVQWSVPTGAPYVSSLVHYDGLVYMANDAGIVTCVDAKTGEKAWQERMAGIFTASPVAGDGKVYLLSETGDVIVMRAGREPRTLERNVMDERMVASPAISDGQIFIRTDQHLVGIGRASRR